ncbi:hypothetical protein [Streptomyces sp. cf124]|uniref:hypothetical protein n=1 Tax=Streptomyces sp. cf124 TaxID=1761903 RepID=UPI00116027B9|nr:hypothetical protein [Streptomyces sp. cf124]
MSDAGDVPDSPEPDAAPLSRWERLAASALGLVLSGSGVAAVFMTSNQAGSVALLLVGVVLLIMAINGSPLTRARYQDYELFMARRRRQVVATLRDDSPEDARQALQVLSTLDPGADRDPVVVSASSYVLEQEVVSRLQRLFPATTANEGPFDYGVDAVVPIEGGSIAVEVRGGTGSVPLSVTELRRIVNKAASARMRLSAASFEGLLVVTNRPLPPSLPRRIRELSPILPTAVVRWVDEQDDQVLEATLRELSSRLFPSG